MGPEVWIGLAAVFVSGGAIGAAGTLLSQWVVRKVNDNGASAAGSLGDREIAILRMEMTDMSRQLQNLDARLDFQEQLLGGATPVTRPPPRFPGPDAPGPES